MNRNAIILLALVGLTTATYRNGYVEIEVEERNYEPQWNHHNRHGGRFHKHGVPHQLLTMDIFNAIAECKEQEWHENNGNNPESDMGCLVACVMQKIGEMNENGKLIESKIVQDIHTKAQIEEKIARSCIAEVHTNDAKNSCDIAEEYVKCVMKKTFNYTSQ